MNKQVLLCVALLGLTGVVCAQPVDKRELAQEFATGVAAGGVSALVVDVLRSLSPSADRLNLYGNFGICRERLTEQVKVASAVAGLTVYDMYKRKKDVVELRKLLARVVGAVVGVNAVAMLRHFIAKAAK